MTGTTGNPLPLRPQLEMLRLAFPQYRIFMRVIGDRLFYLAEAAEPGVQPRFAQAATVDRLRGKLAAPVGHFTVGEPSIPRVWDVLLGGKNNFAIDREQADQLLSVFPQAAELARESREFQRRAITYVASTGVRQFLDIGCGLPTTPNTHETAQAIQPDAAVIYSTTTRSSCRMRKACSPAPRACWPWPETCAFPSRSSTTGASGSSSASTSPSAWC